MLVEWYNTSARSLDVALALIRSSNYPVASDEDENNDANIGCIICVQSSGWWYRHNYMGRHQAKQSWRQKSCSSTTTSTEISVVEGSLCSYGWTTYAHNWSGPKKEVDSRKVAYSLVLLIVKVSRSTLIHYRRENIEPNSEYEQLCEISTARIDPKNRSFKVWVPSSVDVDPVSNNATTEPFTIHWK